MSLLKGKTDNRYLVIVRVGDDSLHHEWLQPAGFKNFDLLLSYYGDQPGRYADECDIYFEQKGPKYFKIHDLFKAYGDQLLEYDAVWISDDDISTNAYNINRMFDIFMSEQLLLAQPALTQNAFFQVTSQHIDYKLRYTNFVEAMVPIFSREALRICYPTFDQTLTGWGLEHVWAKMLNNPHKKFAIIDETPVAHTRPPGEGNLYKNIKKLYKIDVFASNENKLLEQYEIQAPPPEEITFYDGIKKWNPLAHVGSAEPAPGSRPRKFRRTRRLKRRVRLVRKPIKALRRKRKQFVKRKGVRRPLKWRKRTRYTRRKRIGIVRKRKSA